MEEVCVSQDSYVFVFVIGLVSLICFLISTVYFYDKFNKASVNLLNQQQANTSKTISMLFMSLSIIFICVLFIVFFGFTKKMHYTVRR